MRRNVLTIISLLLLPVLFGGFTRAGQSISAADKEKALRYLNDTRARLVEAVKGLTADQLTYKQSPYRWSIAEILEHITVSEQLIQANYLARLASAPSAPQERDSTQVDSMVVSRVPDRSSKFPAPEPLQPTGRWAPAEVLQKFLDVRAKTIAFLESSADLRGHLISHPVLGPMDGYQWVLTIAAHTERHTKQIAEVKADPHFPVE